MNNKTIIVGAIATLILSGFSQFAFSQKIVPQQAKDYIGKKVTVCGLVSNVFYYERGKGSPTFIDMGGRYPKEQLDLVVWKEYREKFSYDLETLDETNICVTGVVKEYRGKPEIEVMNPDQIAKEK